MNEHSLQNQIRNDLAGEMLLFRVNVGQGWTGNAHKLPGNKVLIHNARPFNTGLPPGFSDLFGAVSVVITPEMVGQTVAVLTTIEAKTPKGKPTEKQTNFINAIINAGGRAGVARSVEDARKIAGVGK